MKQDTTIENYPKQVNYKRRYQIVIIICIIIFLIFTLSFTNLTNVIQSLKEEKEEISELLVFQNEMLQYSLNKINMDYEEFSKDFLKYKMEDLLYGNDSRTNT
jgi:nucleoside recognition membrane protein YjiH